MHSCMLHDLLAETVQRYPDKEAIAIKGRSISYSELEKKSNQVAFALSTLEVKTGDRVGIMLPKSIESIIALFGILKIGCIYLPIDPQLPVGRMEQIIRTCGIECLITSVHLFSLIPGVKKNLPLKKALLTEWNPKRSTGEDDQIELIPWESVFHAPEEHRAVKTSDVHPACILHTSDLAGTPKAVVLSHIDALTFVNTAADFFRINAGDRVGSHAPLHVHLSVFDIFAAVKAGAAIILIPELLSMLPLTFAEYVDHEHISVWNSLSPVLAALAERGKPERFGFDSLRLVLFAGEDLSADSIRKLKKQMQNAKFYHLYSRTEARASILYPVFGNA